MEFDENGQILPVKITFEGVEPRPLEKTEKSGTGSPPVKN
jgi:hypothetical protein